MNSSRNGHIKSIGFAILLIGNGIAVGVVGGSLMSDMKHLKENVEDIKKNQTVCNDEVKELRQELNDHLIEDRD